MSDSKRFAGTCYIKVDGEQLAVEGSVEIPLTDVIRETKVGSTGVAGYSETKRIPYVKSSAFLTPSFPISKIAKSDNMTITAELANGWVYTLSQAWLVGEISGSMSDGTTSLEFQGIDGFLQAGK